jgi:hypothetical protein
MLSTTSYVILQNALHYALILIIFRLIKEGVWTLFLKQVALTKNANNVIRY